MLNQFPKSDKDIERILNNVKGYSVFYLMLDIIEKNMTDDQIGDIYAELHAMLDRIQDGTPEIS